MDRTLPTFNEAQDRVKIGHFTKQGYEITGLVHVGANDGYEVAFYLQMGIRPILCFEPLDIARKILYKNYFGHVDVGIVSCALGNFDGVAELRVADGDGKGSSCMQENKKGLQIALITQVPIYRWANLSRQDIDRSKYNCCVIDVQGMELDVLRGMDDQIQQFDFLSVECSSKPIYKGEAPADEVIAYLDRMGFQRDSPIPEHDDVMFINRRVLHPPPEPQPVPRGTRLNIGSGQRRFEGHGWINVDCVSRPGQVPDLLLDVGRDPLPYDDDSMDFVVLHQVYEHFGLGEGHALIRECHRVLKQGGSLIVTVPNMEALAHRWLQNDLEDYLYFVNVYGAYQGEPGDRHAWGYHHESLWKDLDRAAKWIGLKKFDWRPIPGADISRDWWILGMECIK